MNASPQAPPGASPPRRGRGLRLLAGVVVTLAIVAGAAWLVWTRLNPFGENSIDRSQPALLQSIHDLSRFEAATGNFQIIVDLEKDAAFLPDAVKGSRTLFVGAGGVDAYVDFGGLSSGALTVSPDRKEVTVKLPHAQLEKPNLDNGRSYVYAQQRGLFDRVQDFLSSSPADQRELYQLAEKKIAEAAQASDLRDRADQNTKAMLQGMLGGLGFEKVTVTVDGWP
ncbi:DUF4230 domain-containing protein [Streptosporangium sandarakinum]